MKLKSIRSSLEARLCSNEARLRGLEARLCILALLTLSVSSLTQTTFAANTGLTKMPIISNYDLTRQRSLFREAEPLKVPLELIETVEIPTPSAALQGNYSEIFLQNDRIRVCYQTCSDEQNLKPQLESSLGNYVIPMSYLSENSRRNRARDESMLRQTTVYYWVNQVLDKFEKMGHTFSHPLTVLVDREVTDPDIGGRLTNNAFFLSTEIDLVDWSLSFLPANTKPLGILGAGGKTLDTGFDPSVAMHEATHFVFEEVIGPILNPEIYGLHEAFADYFSMAVLNSPEIGRVFYRGKPLRSASKILKYTPNMEAHDLGNVIVSALWNIREKFSESDRDLADQIAFDTLRRLSQTPYAQAASVVTENLQALAEKAPPDFDLTQAEQIWLETGLKPSNSVFDLSAISAPLTPQESTSIASFMIHQKYADSAVLEWGVKPVDSLVVTFGPTRNGPALPGTETGTTKESKWIRIAAQNTQGPHAAATPLWLLIDPATQAILTAVDLTGKEVTPSAGGTFENLTEIAQILPSIQEYAAGFGSELIPLLNKGKWENTKGRKTTTESLSTAFSFGERHLPMTEYTIKTSPTFVGRILGFLGEKSATSIETVKIFTVPEESLQDSRLPKVGSSERMIGYSIIRKTGAISTVKLLDLQ